MSCRYDMDAINSACGIWIICFIKEKIEKTIIQKSLIFYQTLNKKKWALTLLANPQQEDQSVYSSDPCSVENQLLFSKRSKNTRNLENLCLLSITLTIIDTAKMQWWSLITGEEYFRKYQIIVSEFYFFSEKPIKLSSASSFLKLRRSTVNMMLSLLMKASSSTM